MSRQVGPFEKERRPQWLRPARAAGMASIGLASTGRAPEELSSADLVVESLRELTPGQIGALIDSE